MIDLRAGLGAPPIVYPSVPMQHPSVPSGLPGNAPLMPPSQAAQRSLGCVGCTPVMNPGVAPAIPLTGPGVGDLQTWFDRIPLWVKIGVGVATFAGVSYGVYRLVR